MRRFWLLLTVTFFSTMGTAFSQEALAFDFGLRVGIPTKTVLEAAPGEVIGSSTQHEFFRPSFTAGPTFAGVFYDRLLVQFEALYKPVHFVTNETTSVVLIRGNTRGGSWEFPLVFDYRFLRGKVRPYAGGGSVVGQTVSGVTETETTSFITGRTDRVFSQFPGIENQFPAYIVNAGVEFSTNHVVVRPEVRYTRWDNTTGEPRRRRDQVEIVIGFSVRD